MGMRYGRTICSKHDEIEEKALEIRAWCTDDINPSDLSKLFNNLEGLADCISRLAADAKEDGQSMESGLDKKRKRISELEKEKEELEEQVKELEEEKEDLESKVLSLEEDLEELEKLNQP